ncbi:MAG: SBBP repeat-containing protein [Verrucomicrobiota bacterium]
MKPLRLLHLSFGCLLVLQAACLNAPAQSVVQAWVQRYTGPANDNDDKPVAVKIGANGQVFVTGTSRSVADAQNIVTVSYSSTGVPLWTNRYGIAAGVEAVAMVITSDGNVVVTGYAATLFPGFATVAYSSAGLPLWTNLYSAGSDEPKAIAADGNGNVFVTGSSLGSLFTDWATIAYSSTGVPLWTNRYEKAPQSQDGAITIAVAGNGNVIVGGNSYVAPQSYGEVIAYSNSGVPLWTNTYPLTDMGVNVLSTGSNNNIFVAGTAPGVNPGDYNYLTYSISNNGTLLWSKQYKGVTDYQQATAIAVGSDRVFVTGLAFGPNGREFATIAYTGNGVGLWTNLYVPQSSPGYQAWAYALAVSTNNDVYVAGMHNSTNGSQDFLTLAYNSAGLSLWTNHYDGPGEVEDMLHSRDSIALSPDGSVVVTGSSLSTNGTYYATVKYTGPIPIGVQTFGPNVVLTWDYGVFNLQAAPTPTGVFTNVPAATSPFTNTFTPVAPPTLYYRLQAN